MTKEIRKSFYQFDFQQVKIALESSAKNLNLYSANEIWINLHRKQRIVKTPIWILITMIDAAICSEEKNRRKALRHDNDKASGY